MQKKHIGYALGAVMALGLMISQHAFAQTSGALTGDQFFGKDAAGNPISGSDFASTAGLGSGNLPEVIASIIRTILGFLGIVAVVIILMGGFQWMTAGGNETKVKGAKQRIIQGIIGLVIVASAFAIAQFVIGSITGAIQGAG